MDRTRWEYRNFEACIEKPRKTKQLTTADYNAEGLLPIVSQEACLISGYTDDMSFENNFEKPIVIFGDHTRVLKYVDFPFAVGADGVKILVPKDNIMAKFLMSYLQWYDIPSLGYSRHYKLLKEITLPIPPVSDQQAIVAELDKLNEVIALKRKQLADLDSLAQSLFYEMFGDPVANKKGWTTKDLKEVGKITTGNTPSKAVAEYYNNSYIEWIKTDNIEQDSPIATAAKEFLSEEGCKRGRVVDEGSLLVACIAGSVESIGKSCITNRRVAFNQQINAITPNESTNIVFLYHLVRSMKKVIQDYATTGMKHILTKSAMEGITIPLPPLLLQQSFAAKITKIEAEKQRIKSSLKDLETLLASRMQYWFDN
jgi:type I restriction enzyme S subunit